MKKPTVMEQKQCKWVKRQNRDTNMFMTGTMLIALPGFIYGATTGNWSVGIPLFVGGWSTSAIGFVDGYYVQGPYPHEPYYWEKKK
jgi:hypothetical protein